jgi:hypothetical protein
MFKQKLVANIVISTLLLCLMLQVAMFGISISNKKNFSGTVYAEAGIPISGATVWAYGSGGFGYTTTDASGHYLINKGLPTGTYNVTVTKTGYIDAQKGDIAVTVGIETQNANVYLNRSGVIAGKVSDNTTGNGLPNIFVSAMPSGGSGTYFGSAETDANGNYEITTNLATGTYNVSVNLPTNYVGKTIGPVSVTAGAKTTGTDLSLQRSGIISGHIRTPTNVPLANITVIASSFSGGTTYVGTDDTDATGAYRIATGLGTGSYGVSAWSGFNFNTTSGISVTAGSETSNIDLQLTVTPPTPSGIITGKVTDASSNPIVDAHVEAVGNTNFDIGSAQTDSDGNYIIAAGLSTDNYTVTASANGYMDKNVTNINVVLNQTTPNVNLQLQQIPTAQSGSISGTITGDSNPIPEFQYPIIVMLSVTLVTVAIAKSYRSKIKHF